MKSWLRKKMFEIGLFDFISHETYFDVRPMIKFIKDFEIKDIVGVEVGVAKGINALSILETLPIKKLFLVDPYDGVYFEHGGYKGLSGDEMFSQAQDRFRKFNEKICFVVEKSDEAIGCIPNELDFVYIDGDHRYNFVKKDISIWYPKICKGGVIGGHDFDAWCPDVCRAVLEFVDDNDVVFHGECSDWWLVKT